MLDLIHPSLFSIVYGRSRFVPGDQMLSYRELMNASECQVIPHHRVAKGMVLSTMSEKFKSGVYVTKSG